MQTSWDLVKGEIQSVARPFFEALAEKGIEPKAAYLIGGSARGEFNPKSPEVTTLLVFDEIDAELIETIAPLGKKFGKKGLVAPLMLATEHMERAKDSFPLEFFELTSSSRLLFGEDYLAKIKISPTELRVKTERELRLRLIQLQRAYLRSAGDSSWMAEWFAESVEGYFHLFRAAAYIFGENPNCGNTEAARLCAKATGAALSSFVEVWSLRKEGKKPKTSDVRAIFDAWSDGLKTVIAKVDAL